MDYFHNAWMEDGVICFSDHSCFAPPPFPYPYVHHPNPPPSHPHRRPSAPAPPPWPYPSPPHSPPPAIWRSQPFPSPPRRVTVIIPVSDDDVSGAEKSFEINTGSAADSPVAAAVRIQKAYRGFLVRRDLRTISQAAAEFNEVRDLIVSEVDKIRFDPLERLRLIEMLKKLVLRLSTVHISRDNQRMHFRRMLVIIAIGLKNLVNSLAEQSPVLSNEHSIIAWGNFESLLLEVADYPVTDCFGAKRSYIKIEEAPQAEEIERETSIASSGDGFEVLGYTMVEHEDDDESLDGEFFFLSKDDFLDSYLTDMKTEVKTLDNGAAAAENERRRSSGMPACVIVPPIADEAEPVPTILDDNYMSTYQEDKFAENEHSKPISGMPASVGVPPIVDEGEPVPTKQAVDAVNSAETAQKGMEQLVADLCESYLKQSRLVNRLTERVEHLEQMMQSMKK